MWSAQRGICVEEVSWSEQHRYLTLVVDHQAPRVVWGTEGAGVAAADASSPNSTRR